MYRALPQGQAVHDFPLVSQGTNTVTFEDPGHDWPQRIHYKVVVSALRAVVSGTGEGSRTATWTWRRVH